MIKNKQTKKNSQNQSVGVTLTTWRRAKYPAPTLSKLILTFFHLTSL